MIKARKRIEEPEIQRDAKGRVQSVRFAFGAHHFVQDDIEDSRVMFAVGTTHHGVRVEAVDVGSELERMVEELRARYPDRAF